MSCHHIGKETDHQGEGLREHTKQLDGWHDGDRLEEDGHIGPENLFPVLLVAKQVDGEERHEGQQERDVDIARYVRTTREDGQQTHKVGHHNKEEHRQQIRCILLVMLLADRRLDDVVIDHHHQHLNSTYKTAWRLTRLVAFLVPVGTGKEDKQQDSHNDPYL